MTQQKVEGLNTKEMVDFAAAHRGTTKKAAEEFLRDAYDLIKAAILENEAGFNILGVGKFEVVVNPEREHRVPNADTDAPVEYVTKPQHKAIKFRAAKALKEELASKEV